MQNREIEPSQDTNLRIWSSLNQANYPSDSNKIGNMKNSSFALELLSQCEDCRRSKKICINHEDHKEEVIHYLTACLSGFNRHQMIEELKRAFEIDKTIYLEISAEIRYLSRKYELPSFLLEPILHDLKDQDISLNIRRTLAQAVKYGVKNKLDIEYQDLLQAFGENCVEIKSEITWALGYKIEGSNEKISPELRNDMKSKMTEDIDPKAKFFLESQIAKDGEEIPKQVWQENSKNTKIFGKSLKKAPCIVTKNQQALKINHKNTESQESRFEITSITNALKNQQGKAKPNNKIEKQLEAEKSKKGSNLFWSSGTYVNVKNLYKRAMNQEILSDEDKDVYLTNKFFNGTKFWTPGVLGDLITDRIIAATFKTISKEQRLAESTISKLLLCLNDPLNVSANYYQDQDLGSFLQKIFSSQIPEPWNEIEQEIAESMKSKSHDERNRHLFFSEEVAFLRRDAISTLYNCVLRDNKVLTSECMRKMTSCLKDKDKKVRGVAVKILGTLVDNQETVYNEVFKACVSQISENIELELSLDYIDQQSKDSKRCKELFTENVVLWLSSLLNNPSFSHEFKIDCNEIIQNYLRHSWTECLELKVLESICLVLKNDQEENELKEKALISILLASEKNKNLPNSIFESLIENFEKLNDDSPSLILLILIFGTICDQEITNLKCIERISSKLLDDRVVVGEGPTITFESPSSNNISCPAISAITGEIILNFIKKEKKASPEIINNLIEALAHDFKQTKIFAAKALSLASESNLIDLDKDLLSKLEKYITDEIPDVAIYIINAFTKVYSVLLLQQEILISPNHMDLLASIFNDQDLRLDDEDFSARIKKNILMILANQANKQEFAESFFSSFEQIFVSDDPYKKEV